MCFSVLCSINSQALISEKTYPADTNTEIHLVYNISILNDNNLLIVYTVFDSLKNSDVVSLMKIKRDGEKIWQRYIDWPHLLIPVNINEDVNGNISVLCNMGKYYSAVNDYTPALFRYDTDGNFLDMAADTVSMVLRKNETPGLTLKYGDEYLNFSLFKKSLLIKKFGEDLIYKSFYHADTNAGNFQIDGGFDKEGGGFVIAGRYFFNNYEKGTYITSYSADYKKEWQYLDTLPVAIPSYKSIMKSGNNGVTLLERNFPFDYDDSANKKILIKHINNNGIVDLNLEFGNTYFIWPNDFLSLDERGYLILADSIKILPDSEINIYPCLLRADKNGKLLWKKAWGGESKITIIEKGVRDKSGNFYFVGYKENKIYFAHIRDNTLSAGDAGYISLSGSPTVSPNPASGNINIKLENDIPGKVTIGLYDQMGRLIKDLFDDNIQEGAFSLELPIPDIAPGCYSLILRNGSGNCFTEKVMVYR